MRYAGFVVPLVKGMQEQQVMIESQQKRIDELEKLVKQLIEKKHKIILFVLPFLPVCCQQQLSHIHPFSLGFWHKYLLAVRAACL